jgi:hypothetical protein
MKICDEILEVELKLKTKKDVHRDKKQKLVM